MLNTSVVQKEQQIKLAKKEKKKDTPSTEDGRDTRRQRTTTPTSTVTIEEVKEPLLPKRTPKIESSKFPSIIEESVITTQSLNSSMKSRQSSQPVP